MFENPEILIDQLPKVDTVTWLHMDEKYVRCKLANAAITFIILIIGMAVLQTVLRVASAGAELPQVINWLWLAPVLLAVPLFTWPFVSVPKKGYVVRDKDIIYKSGVFWRTVTAIPFNRIQHVEKSSTPLDRKFQLASLQLFTAGGSGGDLEIHGLSAKTAEKLRKFILDKVGSSLVQE